MIDTKAPDGLPSAKQHQAWAVSTLNALKKPADEKRAILKRIHADVIQQLEPLGIAWDKVIVDVDDPGNRRIGSCLDSIHAKTGKNLNQIADFQNFEAIVWMIASFLTAMEPQDGHSLNWRYDMVLNVLKELFQSLDEPTDHAKPNARAASGFSYGYHQYWTVEGAKGAIKVYADPAWAERIADSINEANDAGLIATDEPDEPAVVNVEPTKFDANLASAVNQLLGTATGDRVTDIVGLIKSDETAKQMVTTLEGELEEARQALLSAPTITSIETSPVDMDGVTHKATMKKATLLFKSPANRTMNGLDFNVPVLSWKDAKGKAMANPQVPPIDREYAFRPEMLTKFLAAMVKGHNVWLHGHTGTGKTTFFEQVAARLSIPFFRLNLDANLERADLVGQITLTQEGGTTVTKFDEGILPQAMQQPAWLCFDECDSGRPDILFVLQRALEQQGLMLTEDGGRIVRPHPMFRFMATANSRGQGDEFGVYSGVRPMNAAFMNRWNTLIEVPYLNKGDEKALLVKKFPKLAKEKAVQLAQFGVEVRKAFVNGEVSLPLSPRDLFAAVEMWAFFTIENKLMEQEAAWDMALEMSILDKAPSDNRQRILELKQRCLTS